MTMDRIGTIGRLLRLFGKKIVFLSEYDELLEQRLHLRRFTKVEKIAKETNDPELCRFLITHAKSSYSQELQDLIALYFTQKKVGYFVEFGATDGIELSNTYLLESEYGWKGILAEPAQIWHAALHANRKCHISTKCVYSVTGEKLNFSEVQNKTLSTISEYSAGDLHSAERLNQKRYEVDTITLLDLLNHFGAPNYIDFLSVDTEGSEFQVLQNFPFDRYKFGFICIEHNFTENERRVDELLLRNGYRRILRHSSDFDGWYVHTNLGNNY
jgi:FkbM family methyltransferase